MISKDIKKHRKERLAPQEKIKENLPGSEEKYRMLVNSTKAIPWICDLSTWQFTFVGAYAETLLGYRIEEWYQENFWQNHIHPDDREKAVNYCLASTQRLEDHEFEYRMIASDGQIIWIYDIAKVTHSKGEPIQLHGFMIDITERKRMEEELRILNGSLEQRIAERTAELAKANEKLLIEIDERKQAEKSIKRQARVAMLGADVGAALTMSDTLSMMLQKCTESLVNHLDATFARIWTLDKEENMLELQASSGIYTHIDGSHSRVSVGSLKIGLIAQEQKPHLTNDVMNDPRISDREWARREGMVAFAGYPLIVEDRLVGVMAMFACQQLTKYTLDALASVSDEIALGIERKQGEEKLGKFEILFNNISDLAYICDTEGKILFVNNIFEKLSGYKPEEFIGKSFVSLFNEENQKRAVDAYTRTLRGESPEYELCFKGTGILCEYKNLPLRDGKGDIIGVIGTARNISERKNTEDILLEQKRALEQKNIALSEVLGQIEIEKKQIKDNVITNAETLLLPIIQKLRLTGESRKYVQLLRNNLQELTSSFGTRLTEKRAKLTSREIEICNMVRNGLTSKEIASLLNISSLTIEKHRINIRRKLGIINKDINLTSFLKTL